MRSGLTQPPPKLTRFFGESAAHPGFNPVNNSMNNMNRRNFLKSSVTAATLAGLPAIAAEGTAPREFYELRRYQFRFGPMVKRFEQYVTHAALPALQRMGIGPIGVFTPTNGPDTPAAYVLVPFKSLAEFASVGEQLQRDPEYQKAGDEYINAPATDPPYLRYESSLLLAFTGMPKLAVPEQKKASRSRLFELRTYESHSRRALKTKVKMFNEGELEIFRRTGLAPVFFGETLIGPKQPNLTYMVVFDDMDHHGECWDKFRNDPEWKKLSAQPGYSNAEIVSNISSSFLKPMAYSQL